MGIGSNDSELHIPNAQLSKCGFVRDTIQSQTSIVSIPSSRQPCISNRCSFREMEFTSCICLSSYNSDTCTFYSSQDMPISVQNSSHCSFLAPTAMVLRVTTTSSVSPNSSSTLSKTSDIVKRKISTPKPPISRPLRLGVIKQSEVKSLYNHAYAFPPTILIPSILAKICQSQCRIVLIAPFWPQRPWFSELLQLLVSAPIHLPLFPRLLT